MEKTITPTVVTEEKTKRTGFRGWSFKKKAYAILIIFALLWIIIATRSTYHQLVLAAWKYKAWLIIGALLLFIAYKCVRSKPKEGKSFSAKQYILKKIVIPIISIGLIVAWFTPPARQAYHELYMQSLYNSLDKEEITILPYTKNERIHARGSILAYAYSKTNNNLPVSKPHLIHDPYVDSVDNVWSMANLTVQKNLWQIEDDIKEVFLLPSHINNPNLQQHRYEVIFNTGESMHYDKDAFVNAIKVLGFRFINTEPDDVYYMHDDDGNLVQVVSLIRWTGFFFPKPVFGGVVVIPSKDISMGRVITRNLFGFGKYISPSECAKYKFLDGQNLFSEKVTQLYAESFSYRHGIYKAKFDKKDAVEIPNILEGDNEYPFVSDYDWSHTGVKTSNGLYHYIPVEPSDSINTSLALSLFLRSDGKGKIYYYDHSKAKDGVSGVSAVVGIVKKKYPAYSWDHFHIADVRTYFPDIPELKSKGRLNYFYITSIVAVNKQFKQFDAGTLSDLMAVNALDNEGIPLNSSDPKNWANQIRSHYNKLDGIKDTFLVDTVVQKVFIKYDTIIPPPQPVVVHQPVEMVVKDISVGPTKDTVSTKETMKQATKDTIKQVTSPTKAKPKSKKKKG